MPHVTINATEEKTMARIVFRRRAGEKTSRMGFDCTTFRTDCFHFSDSGTKRRIKNVSAAGSAPTIITHRQESRVTSTEIAIRAMIA